MRYLTAIAVALALIFGSASVVGADEDRCENAEFNEKSQRWHGEDGKFCPTPEPDDGFKCLYMNGDYRRVRVNSGALSFQTYWEFDGFCEPDPEPEPATEPKPDPNPVDGIGFPCFDGSRALDEFGNPLRFSPHYRLNQCAGS